MGCRLPRGMDGACRRGAGGGYTVRSPEGEGAAYGDEAESGEGGGGACRNPAAGENEPEPDGRTGVPPCEAAAAARRDRSKAFDARIRSSCDVFGANIGRT